GIIGKDGHWLACADDEKWATIAEKHPHLVRDTMITLRPGKNQDAYFDWKQFKAQMENAFALAKELYPEKNLIFVLDNSAIHRTWSEDALRAKAMNVKP